MTRAFAEPEATLSAKTPGLAFRNARIDKGSSFAAIRESLPATRFQRQQLVTLVPRRTTGPAWTGGG